MAIWITSILLVLFGAACLLAAYVINAFAEAMANLVVTCVKAGYQNRRLLK